MKFLLTVADILPHLMFIWSLTVQVEILRPES
jgi:hypothetical protein